MLAASSSRAKKLNDHWAVKREKLLTIEIKGGCVITAEIKVSSRDFHTHAMDFPLGKFSNFHFDSVSKFFKEFFTLLLCCMSKIINQRKGNF